MRKFLVLFVLLYTLESSACDCGYVGSFLKVAPKTSFVAVVKVVRYVTLSNPGNSPRSIEVEVVDVIKGKEKRKHLVVWGDDGHLCRPFVSQFKVDSVYVMALHKGSVRWGQRGEKPSDYSISNCGTHWLSVDRSTGLINGDVVGDIRDSSAITLGKLKVDLSATRR